MPIKPCVKFFRRPIINRGDGFTRRIVEYGMIPVKVSKQYTVLIHTQMDEIEVIVLPTKILATPIRTRAHPIMGIDPSHPCP